MASATKGKCMACLGRPGTFSGAAATVGENRCHRLWHVACRGCILLLRRHSWSYSPMPSIPRGMPFLATISTFAIRTAAGMCTCPLLDKLRLDILDTVRLSLPEVILPAQTHQALFARREIYRTFRAVAVRFSSKSYSGYVRYARLRWPGPLRQ